MICPACGARLNVLAGRDGFGVVPAASMETRDGRIVERRIVANVYACPRCEFVQAGAAGLPGDTFAAWARHLERLGLGRAVEALASADDLAYYQKHYGRAR